VIVRPPLPSNTVTLWRKRPRPLERLSGPVLVVVLYATAWCLGAYVLPLWAFVALLVLAAKSAGILAWRTSEYERLYRDRENTED
jgi:hypothetical protein